MVNYEHGGMTNPQVFMINPQSVLIIQLLTKLVVLVPQIPPLISWLVVSTPLKKDESQLG